MRTRQHVSCKAEFELRGLRAGGMYREKRIRDAGGVKYSKSKEPNWENIGGECQKNVEYVYGIYAMLYGSCKETSGCTETLSTCASYGIV
jgi:hypothetical protein